MRNLKSWKGFEKFGAKFMNLGTGWGMVFEMGKGTLRMWSILPRMLNKVINVLSKYTLTNEPLVLC